MQRTVIHKKHTWHSLLNLLVSMNPMSHQSGARTKALTRCVLSVVVGMLIAFSDSSAQGENISTSRTIPESDYDYQAVCQFINSHQEALAHTLDDDKGKHSVAQSLEGVQAAIKIYRYRFDGITGEYFVKDSNSERVLTDAHFDSKTMPDSMRSRSYFWALFSIKSDPEKDNSVSLGCEHDTLLLTFDRKDLKGFDISTLVD
jgi:hypothetical protein